MTIPAHLSSVYIERRPRKTWNLVFVSGPCNGTEYAQAPRLPFCDKASARAFCKDRGLTPINF